MLGLRYILTYEFGKVFYLKIFEITNEFCLRISIENIYIYWGNIVSYYLRKWCLCREIWVAMDNHIITSMIIDPNANAIFFERKCNWRKLHLHDAQVYKN